MSLSNHITKYASTDDPGKDNAVKSVTFGFNTTVTSVTSVTDTDLVGGVILGSPYPTGGAADAEIAVITGPAASTGKIKVTLAAASTAAVTYTAVVTRGTGN